MLILLFVLILHKTAAFHFTCPKPSERYLRGKGICTDYRNYTCLFDENRNTFSESCSIQSDFQRPDYQCINQFSWSGKFLCSSISNLREPKATSQGNEIHTRTERRDVIRIKRTAFLQVFLNITIVLFTFSIVLLMLLPRKATECLYSIRIDREVNQEVKEIGNLKLPELLRSGSSNTQLMEWKNKMESFMETPIITEIKEKLKSVNYILLWGKPGCCKTTLAHNITMYLENDFDFKPIHCVSPSDIFQHQIKTGKCVFVIDDICGRFVFSHERFLRWKRREKHIERLVEADNVKLIMTCSAAAFMTDIVQHFPLFTDNAFSLPTSSVMPSNIHKFEKHDQQILTHIIKHYVTDNTSLSMIKFGLSLPFYEALEFFIDISEYYNSKVEELFNSNRSAFYSLFICILNTGTIDEAVLTSDDNRSFNELTSEICVELCTDISKQQFLNSLKFLMESFISKENGSFFIKHAALFEVLAVYFGTKLQKVLVKYADQEIITQHCSLKTFRNIPGNASFDIQVKEENEDMYFKRITEQLLSRNICEVFSVRQIRLSGYRQKLIDCLQKQGQAIIKQISLSKCKIDSETSLSKAMRYGYFDLVKLFFDNNENLDSEKYEYLEDACKTNNVPLVKFLVSRHVKINKCMSEGCTALHIACKNEFLSLTHYLVRNNADVNCADMHGNTPLLEACKNENKAIVLLLLKNGADINMLNKNGHSPLMMASMNRRTHVIDLLIANGAEVKNS